MILQPKHIVALDRAEGLMFHSDFCPYFELKKLFPIKTPQAREQFRYLFTKYYGLNVGGLTKAFKDRYFEILFDGNVVIKGRPDFQTILTELSLIPRAKGDYAMPYSFVSKLAAAHLDCSPIYDRHVLRFFGEKAPSASRPKPERIAWFEDFLKNVAADYEAWSRDRRVAPIIRRLQQRDLQLAGCHVVRLIDFLVWKVGNQKLL